MWLQNSDRHQLLGETIGDRESVEIVPPDLSLLSLDHSIVVTQELETGAECGDTDVCSDSMHGAECVSE